MRGIAAEMHALKPDRGKSDQSRAAWQALEQRYRDLSASLGGDDPGEALLSGSNSSAAITSAQMRPPVSQAVPPLDAACGETTTAFSNSTPAAIPDEGGAVVT